MTLPNERTRAIIQAETFLIELSKDKSICDEKRQEARRLLRHYPSRKEILLAGQIEEKLTAGTIFTPFLSSTTETMIPGSFEREAEDSA
ncbi:BPSL0761 family protein [Halomonas sp. AOP42-C2-23]|uniref:BPSL0761 family protein n=1 Tax=unclassified Halomonas TaxID=2609666 RepID=UPI0030CF5566|tara:strand:+ start:1197 stop:1463 length:267 start_codon:yes stop_codon:yes gene_type:complete